MSRAAVRIILLLGLLYLAAGLGFGALAGRASTVPVRNAWRWAAWVVSLCAFAWHIAYGLRRMQLSNVVAARNAAFACALGSFGLAVAANVHALTTTTTGPSTMLRLSLIIWPVVTAIPAFVAACVFAVLFVRVMPRA